MEPQTFDVGTCARCGRDHEGLLFEPFACPHVAGVAPHAITFTHWAPCPTNGEPILMRFVEK